MSLPLHLSLGKRRVIMKLDCSWSQLVFSKTLIRLCIIIGVNANFVLRTYCDAFFLVEQSSCEISEVPVAVSLKIAAFWNTTLHLVRSLLTIEDYIAR
jgi:hypothetical protein